MLRMAFELRAIIIVLDGLDEAAGRSKAIEHLIFEDLVPMGFRCVITSRPEGISNLERFASSGFIIMNLEPLTEDQQLEAINGQLKGDEKEATSHLFAFTMIREKLDKMYKDNFPEDQREVIEEFMAPNLFKIKEGKFEQKMRQHIVGSSRYVTRLSDGEPIQSKYLME